MVISMVANCHGSVYRIVCDMCNIVIYALLQSIEISPNRMQSNQYTITSAQCFTLSLFIGVIWSWSPL